MNSRFKKIQDEIDEELWRIFEARTDIPQKLLESMVYSTFSGGKRIRPMLVMAAAEAVGGNRNAALTTAAAFELIHTYTLIHDDLPAMDDDDLRRGKPTNHKKFGEATAILAGDALLTLAFEVMAQPNPNGYSLAPELQIKVIKRAAQAVGAQGTVGGQSVDIKSEGLEGDLEKLEYIHTHKTGAMIAASVEAGGLLGGGNEEELKKLSIFGNRVGHAFQIIDDILDVTGKTEELGKPAGSDMEKMKMTYPSLMGLEKSRELADKIIAQAVEAVEGLKGNNETLVEIAGYIGKRNH